MGKIFWLVGGSLVAALWQFTMGRAQFRSSTLDTWDPAAAVSASAASASAAAEAAAKDATQRFVFEVVHRQLITRDRAFDAVEAKLGVIALAGLTLVAAYFPTDLTTIDIACVFTLVTAAAIALVGFAFFRGFDGFEMSQFTASMTESPAVLDEYTAILVNIGRHNETMIAIKRVLMLCALIPIVVVAALIPFTRHVEPVIPSAHMPFLPINGLHATPLVSP